jgi:hypothetical protein
LAGLAAATLTITREDATATTSALTARLTITTPLVMGCLPGFETTRPLRNRESPAAAGLLQIGGAEIEDLGIA